LRSTHAINVKQALKASSIWKDMRRVNTWMSRFHVPSVTWNLQDQIIWKSTREVNIRIMMIIKDQPMSVTNANPNSPGKIILNAIWVSLSSLVICALRHFVQLGRFSSTNWNTIPSFHVASESTEAQWEV
jgi:hypothetical protein